MPLISTCFRGCKKHGYQSCGQLAGLLVLAVAAVFSNAALTASLEATDLVSTRIVVSTEQVSIPLTPTGKLPPLSFSDLDFQGDRAFVSERNGRIYLLDARRNRIFLDVSATRPEFVADSEHLGLLGVAFHPAFSTPRARGYGKLYTVHTQAPSGALDGHGSRLFASTIDKVHHHDVLVEWSVENATDISVEADTARVVLMIPQPFEDHNVGRIGFNSNAAPGDADFGNLYISVGDGGATEAFGMSPDAYLHAQDLTSPLGKILRIDPLPGAAGPLQIPVDNPFVLSRQALPEIWAYGFRDPRHFSWDTGAGGTMLIVDIGHLAVDEISHGVAGGNYGWSVLEGRLPTALHGKSPTDSAGFTPPSVEIAKTSVTALVGGFVYRGPSMPQLDGRYVFADSLTGTFHAVDVQNTERFVASESSSFSFENADRVTVAGGETPADSMWSGLTLALDSAGELYFITASEPSLQKLFQKRASAVEPVPNYQTALDIGSDERNLFHLGLGVVFLMVCLAAVAAMVVLRRRYASGGATVDDRPAQAFSGRERVVGGARFFFDDDEQCVRINTARNAKSERTFRFDAIESLSINTNGALLAQVSTKEPLSAADRTELEEYFALWSALELGEQDERRIELDFALEPRVAPEPRVLIYLRIGSRRHTHDSYTATVPKLLALVAELSAINSDTGPGGVAPTNREATADGRSLATREALLLRHHAEGYLTAPELEAAQHKLRSEETT